jgi:hypothetical protein
MSPVEFTDGRGEGVGEEPKSYNREKASPSIKNSILSVWQIDMMGGLWTVIGLYDEGLCGKMVYSTYLVTVTTTLLVHSILRVRN